MPIILKPSALKVKDDNGNYIGMNMFAAESTQEYLDAIETIGTQTQTAISSASTQAQAAMEAKAEQTIESIPEDYTELAGDVTELKADLNQIIVDNKVIPTWHQGYINTSTGATGSDPNYCYCDYIEATGFTYKITGVSGYNVKVALYNASKVFDSITVALTSNLPVTFRPDKGTFFRIQYGLGNAATTPSDITDDVFGLTYASFTDPSLTMPGKSADAKVVGDAVSAFEDAFEKINKNIINEYTGTLSVTGTYVPFAFSVFEGKKYKMTNQSTAGAMLAYTRETPTGENIDNILGVGIAAGYSQEFTATADAFYIAVYVNTSTTGAKFTIEQLDNIPDRVSETENVCEIADEALSYTIDPKNLTSQIGVGVNTSTGVFSGTDSTNVVFPDYIEINKTTAITNHNTTRYVDEIMTVSRVFFYDISKQNISNAVLLPLETAIIPENAKYVRFSYTYLQTTMTSAVAETFNTDVVSKLLDIKGYVDNSIATAVPPVFYVGSDRLGENTFKTLKAATEYIWNNDINGATVYIDRGTYDLVTEYGSEYLEGLVDPGSNPRALGLKCGKNTRFIFESGAKIQFLYSGSNTYVAQMFSPVNIAGSCVFENMEIVAQNARYCVHEDFYTINTDYTPYTVKYLNCCMLYKEKTLEGGTNGEPIGAGCMPGSTSIIDGGRYENEVNQADISYHNYAISSFGAGTSNVFIKNAWMKHWCSFGLYGDSVVHGFISGCRMASDVINGYADNVITKWNNEIDT